jgi:hypothetical protein
MRRLVPCLCNCSSISSVYVPLSLLLMQFARLLSLHNSPPAHIMEPRPHSVRCTLGAPALHPPAAGKLQTGDALMRAKLLFERTRLSLWPPGAIYNFYRSLVLILRAVSPAGIFNYYVKRLSLFWIGIF